MREYEKKFEGAIQHSFYAKLPQKEREFIKQKAFEFRFSYQEIKQIVDMARDLEMWSEGSIRDIFVEHPQKKVALSRLKKAYKEIRDTPNSYDDFKPKTYQQSKNTLFRQNQRMVLGLVYALWQVKKQGVVTF